MRRRVRPMDPTVRPILPVRCGLVGTRGDRYRQARDALKLTREQLAARARVSPKTIQRLETNDPQVGRAYRLRVERELGINRDDRDDTDDRSITEFSDAVLVGELLRRLEEVRRRRPRGDAHDHDSHTDIEEGPAPPEDMTSSG